MGLQEKILEAEYKKVKFLVKSELETEYKKKYAVYEYPNSSKRIIENRGINGGRFVITAVINGFDDYFIKRDKFIKVLKEQSAGILIHPTNGILIVKCVNFSYQEDITDALGNCIFSLEFLEDNETKDINPEIVINSSIAMGQTIEDNNRLLALSLDMKLKLRFALALLKIIAKLDSLNKLFSELSKFIPAGMIEAFGAMLNFALALPSCLNNLITTFENYSSILEEIVSIPLTLGSGLFNTFKNLERSITNPFDRYKGMLSMFSFGDNDVKQPSNTQKRIELNENNEVINNSIQTFAFNIACNAISEIDFNDDEQLQEAKNILNAQYQKLIKNDFYSNAKNKQTLEILNNLKQTKVYLDNIFKEKETTTPKITTISVNNTTVSLICFSYYGNLDNVDKIIKLNNISNPFNVSGNIRVFENANTVN